MRNYTFGAKAPRVNSERVADQMRLAHRYRNALVEIDRWKRGALAELQTRMIPGLADAQEKKRLADEAIESHLVAVKSRNASARDKAASAADRAKTKELKDARKVMYEAIKALKTTEKSPEFIAACSTINDEYNAKWRAARGASGLWAGTYMVAENDARASFSTSRGLPKFMKWEGHGTVGFNDSPGIPIEKAFSGDTKLRIENKVKPEGFSFGTHTVYLRIGSDEEDNRVPVWAIFDIKLHRPIPEGSIVKWAYLMRTRIGAQNHWEFRLTLDIPQESLPVVRRAKTGTVGIDVGWRLTDDGLRVAAWAGSDGKTGSLVIPWARIEQMRRPDVLHSTRDHAFNEVRQFLASWAKDRIGARAEALCPQRLPEWFSEAIKTLSQWRSQGRLAMLIIKWRESRFDGDGAVFDAMEAWRKQDKHLWNWEGHGRSTNWRKEMYREFAVKMRESYAKIIIEDTTWTKFAKKAPADSPEHDIAEIRWNARLASVGQLCGILTAFAGATKSRAADTTRKCNSCGSIEEFPAEREVVHACSECGLVWDQDENAAKNLLASGSVVVTSGEPREVSAVNAVKKKISMSEWRARARQKRASRKMASKCLVGAV